MLKKIWTFLQPKIGLLSLIVKGLGALLILLSLLGVFKHHKRIEFYNDLKTKKEMPADSPMTKKVMREFELSDEEIKLTEKIKLQFVGIVQVGPPTPDTLVAYGKHFEPRIMGNVTKLQQWANSGSKLYEWIGFILVAIGVVVDTMLHWQQNRKMNYEILPEPNN